MNLALVRLAAVPFTLLSFVVTPLCARVEAANIQNETEAEGQDQGLVIKDGKTTIQGIEFDVGPCTGRLGSTAEVAVPEGFLFTGKKGTAAFLTLTQNPTGGSEVGTVLNQESGWFVIFEYEETGHVKDDEKDKLDADDLLDTLKEGNEAGNEARKERGWATIELVGWHKPPFYDPKTNNLTWSTLLKSGTGETVNWSTKLLGRTGTMSVDLVIGPAEIDAAMPSFEALLGGFRYDEGHQYAEFKPGDKIAEYGLAALVAGGAGAVAFKTGLLAKFWKFILAGGKFIVIGVIAAFVALRKFLGFGKKDAPGGAES